MSLYIFISRASSSSSSSPQFLHKHSLIPTTFCRNMQKPVFASISFYTNQKHFLHKLVFTHITFTLTYTYTNQLVHKPVSTKTWFDPSHLLHQSTFTATTFYTNQLSCFFALTRLSQEKPCGQQNAEGF